MVMTVADVVSLPVVQSADPQILSDSGFARVVRWVHVSDIADLSRLLQGGELVLTRGAALRRSPRRYLQRLRNAGAVGVIVEVQPDAPPLPQSAGAVAEELGLALVVLHKQVMFVEVTEQVHRSIVAEQFDEVDFARRLHENFTDLSMRRATATDIVDAAANLAATPIVLEDLSHQALVLAAAGRSASTLLNNWERRSRINASGGSADGPEMPWSVTTVGRAPEHWGRLIAIGPNSAPARIKMVMERAAQALVLQRMAEKDRSDIEHQVTAGLIDDVRRHRIGSTTDVTARAFALGLRPSRSYTAAVARATHWSVLSDPVAEHRRNKRLLDMVVQTTRAMGHTGLFTTLGPGEVGIVLSLGTTRGDDAETMLQLGDAISRDSRRDAVDLVLGIGTAVSDLPEAIERIDEAAHVAEVAASLPPTGRTAFAASDIHLRGLLALLRGDPRVQRFAESELRALLLHDINHNDDCTNVLRGYLELAHRKTALAARLHLSRPALYAKLARIEKFWESTSPTERRRLLSTSPS